MPTTAQRGPTFIALRARRESLHVAQEIAYPQIPRGTTELLPALAVAPLLDPVYEPPIVILAYDPPGPAPRWMWGLLAACVIVIAIAAFMILRTV